MIDEEIIKLLSQVEGDAKMLLLVWVGVSLLKTLMGYGVLIGFLVLLYKAAFKISSACMFNGQVKNLCEHDTYYRNGKEEVLELIKAGMDKKEQK